MLNATKLWVNYETFIITSRIQDSLKYMHAAIINGEKYQEEWHFWG